MSALKWVGTPHQLPEFADPGRGAFWMGTPPGTPGKEPHPGLLEFSPLLGMMPGASSAGAAGEAAPRIPRRVQLTNLANQAKGGDESAFNQLFNMLSGTAQRLATRYTGGEKYTGRMLAPEGRTGEIVPEVNQPSAYHDALSAANERIWSALQSFDPTKGAFGPHYFHQARQGARRAATTATDIAPVSEDVKVLMRRIEAWQDKMEAGTALKQGYPYRPSLDLAFKHLKIHPVDAQMVRDAYASPGHTGAGVIRLDQPIDTRGSTSAQAPLEEIVSRDAPGTHRTEAAESAEARTPGMTAGPEQERRLSSAHSALRQAQREFQRDNERDWDIYNRWFNGETMRQIGDVHGVGKSQIQRIIEKTEATLAKRARELAGETDPRTPRQQAGASRPRAAAQQQAWETPETGEIPPGLPRLSGGSDRPESSGSFRGPLSPGQRHDLEQANRVGSKIGGGSQPYNAAEIAPQLQPQRFPGAVFSRDLNIRYPYNEKVAKPFNDPRGFWLFLKSLMGNYGI